MIGRRLGISALLVAVLAAATLSLNALHTGAVHAQSPEICLSIPASDTVTCLDESGDLDAAFAAPIVVAPVVATTPDTTSCFTDESGNFVCPPSGSAALGSPPSS